MNCSFCQYAITFFASSDWCWPIYFLSFICIAISVCFEFSFAWNIIFYSFTFNQYMEYPTRWVSCRQSRVGSYFLNLFSYLLSFNWIIKDFNWTFKVIIGKYLLVLGIFIVFLMLYSFLILLICLPVVPTELILAHALIMCLSSSSMCKIL